MAQTHHDPAEESTESHPVKLAIAVTVGAFSVPAEVAPNV